MDAAWILASELEDIGVSSATNYRNGKWPFPPDKISVLCKRFGSYTLANVINNETRAEEISPLDASDIGEKMTEALRQVCEHHTKLMDAFKRPGGIDKATLDLLDESLQDIIHRERHLFSLAEHEYEQALTARRRRA